MLQGFRSELSRFLGIPRVSSKPKACTQTKAVDEASSSGGSEIGSFTFSAEQVVGTLARRSPTRTTTLTMATRTRTRRRRRSRRSRRRRSRRKRSKQEEQQEEQEQEEEEERKRRRTTTSSDGDIDDDNNAIRLDRGVGVDADIGGCDVFSHQMSVHIRGGPGKAPQSSSRYISRCFG